jgi:hypothetical protein
VATSHWSHLGSAKDPAAIAEPEAASIVARHNIVLIIFNNL